jgi:aconitate hydratase
MIRGTFANIRLRNLLLDDVAGGYTRDFTQDDGPQAFIYDAAQNYAAQDIPLVVLGGKEYGSGSSRDWAAKGTLLLGVRAVIAESFERIHRSNLIGMGVIPLQFPEGKSAEDLGLDGTEVFDITGIEALNDGKTPKTVQVKASKDGKDAVEFDAAAFCSTCCATCSSLANPGPPRCPRSARIIWRLAAVRSSTVLAVALPNTAMTEPRCGGWNRR